MLLEFVDKYRADKFIGLTNQQLAMIIGHKTQLLLSKFDNEDKILYINNHELMRNIEIDFPIYEDILNHFENSK